MRERKPMTLLTLLVLATSAAGAATITEIIDATGDGMGNTYVRPWGIAVDVSGNAYVTGVHSHNAFKIATPGTCSTGGTPCTITQIINATGDGMGNTLAEPHGIAVDVSGNVYVAGLLSENVFKITPGGTITEIIDAMGDGGGNPLSSPDAIAVDESGNVYVAGSVSDNVFKIATPSTCSTGGTPCTITEIINATGDGGGNPLSRPLGIAVDESSNVYVTGNVSNNAFKITPGGTITEIIDATGDGMGNPIDAPRGIAVNGSDNAYVAGSASDNAFKIGTPGMCSTGGTPCTITEMINGTAGLDTTHGIAVNGSDNLYVVGRGSDSALKITPGGTITEFIDATGDGGGNSLINPEGIAVDGSGNVYLVGLSSENAFKVPAALTPVELVSFAIE